MPLSNLKNLLAYFSFWGSIASGLFLVFSTVAFGELSGMLARSLVLLGSLLVLLPLLTVWIAVFFQQRSAKKTHALAKKPAPEPGFWAPPVLISAGEGLSSPNAASR